MARSIDLAQMELLARWDQRDRLVPLGLVEIRDRLEPLAILVRQGRKVTLVLPDLSVLLDRLDR